MSTVDVVPVGLRQPVIWIHSQNVFDVGGKAIVEIETRIVWSLLNHHREAVAGLCKAIELVFFESLSAGFENQANVRPVERRRTKVSTCTGNSEVQRSSCWKDAITRVEPDCSGFGGLDRKAEVREISLWPQRILDLDIQRKESVADRLHV